MPADRIAGLRPKADSLENVMTRITVITAVAALVHMGLRARRGCVQHRGAHDCRTEKTLVHE